MSADRSSRLALAALGACALSALVVAWIAQYGFALWPCMLCYWQRVPYIAVVALAVLGSMPAVDAASRRQLVWLAAALFAASGAIGLYHAGVEYRWWPGPVACGGPVQAVTMTDLLAAVSRPGRTGCEEAAFRFFGISMAGYNALYAAAATALSVWIARRRGLWMSSHE